MGRNTSSSNMFQAWQLPTFFIGEAMWSYVKPWISTGPSPAVAVFHHRSSDSWAPPLPATETQLGNSESQGKSALRNRNIWPNDGQNNSMISRNTFFWHRNNEDFSRESPEAMIKWGFGFTNKWNPQQLELDQRSRETATIKNGSKPQRWEHDDIHWKFKACNSEQRSQRPFNIVLERL